MKKFLTLATLATIALTSCNNDNDVPTPNVEAGQILFGAEALTAETKAPFEGTISTSNPLTAMIIGSSITNNYNAIYTDEFDSEAKGDITFTDNGKAQSGFNSGVKWKTSDTKLVYFRGFYPGSAAWTMAGGTKSTAKIDGKTDLMVASEISASTVTVVTNPLIFRFSHLLTKLHVKVGGTKSTAKDWGNITKIELSKAVNAMPSSALEYTYAGNVVALSTPLATPFYQASESNVGGLKYTNDEFKSFAYAVPAEGVALAAYSLVAPVTGVVGNGDVQDEYTLKITTDKGTGIAGKEVPINLKNLEGEDFTGSTAGKKFDIIIQFRSEGQILASATVTEWEDGGSGNGNM